MLPDAALQHSVLFSRNFCDGNYSMSAFFNLLCSNNDAVDIFKTAAAGYIKPVEGVGIGLKRVGFSSDVGDRLTGEGLQESWIVAIQKVANCG